MEPETTFSLQPESQHNPLPLVTSSTKSTSKSTLFSQLSLPSIPSSQLPHSQVSTPQFQEISAQSSPPQENTKFDPISDNDSIQPVIDKNQIKIASQTGTNTPQSLSPIPELSSWQTVESGKAGSLSYRARIFEWNNCREISPWHGIPLHGNNNHFHVVCKTPRGSGFIFETALDEDCTPLKLKKQPSRPAYYTCNAPCHVGLLPQTFADPLGASDGMQQDGNPIEVLDIGSRTARTGQVYSAKVLAAFAVIHGGTKLSWKIIVIAVDDPMAGKLNNVDDVQEKMPEVLGEVREWLRTCMWRHSGDPDVYFGLDGTAGDSQLALTVIAKAHRAWQRKFGDKEKQRSGTLSSTGKLSRSRSVEKIRSPDSAYSLNPSQRVYAVHQSHIKLSGVTCCEKKKTGSDSHCGHLWVDAGDRPPCIPRAPPPGNPTPTSMQSPAPSRQMVIETGSNPVLTGIGCWKGMIGKLRYSGGGLRIDPDLQSVSTRDGVGSSIPTASRLQQRRRPPTGALSSATVSRQNTDRARKDESEGRADETGEMITAHTREQKSSSTSSSRLSGSEGRSKLSPMLDRSQTFSEGQFAVEMSSKKNPPGIGLESSSGAGDLNFTAQQEAKERGEKLYGIEGEKESEPVPSLERSQTISEGQFVAQKQARGSFMTSSPGTGSKSKETYIGQFNERNKEASSSDFSVPSTGRGVLKNSILSAGIQGSEEVESTTMESSLERSQTISEGHFSRRNQSRRNIFGMRVDDQTLEREDVEFSQFGFQNSSALNQEREETRTSDRRAFTQKKVAWSIVEPQEDPFNVEPSFDRSQTISEGQFAAERSQIVKYNMRSLERTSNMNVRGSNRVEEGSSSKFEEDSRQPNSRGKKYVNTTYRSESFEEGEGEFVGFQAHGGLSSEQTKRNWQEERKKGGQGSDDFSSRQDEKKVTFSGEKSKDDRAQLRERGVSVKKYREGTVVPFMTMDLLRRREQLTQKLEKSSWLLAAEEEARRGSTSENMGINDMFKGLREDESGEVSEELRKGQAFPGFGNSQIGGRRGDSDSRRGQDEKRIGDDGQTSQISSSRHSQGAGKGLDVHSFDQSSITEEQMDQRWETDIMQERVERRDGQAASRLRQGDRMASYRSLPNNRFVEGRGSVRDELPDETRILEREGSGSLTQLNFTLGKPAAFVTKPVEYQKRS